MSVDLPSCACFYHFFSSLFLCRTSNSVILPFIHASWVGDPPRARGKPVYILNRTKSPGNVDTPHLFFPYPRKSMTCPGFHKTFEVCSKSLRRVSHWGSFIIWKEGANPTFVHYSFLPLISSLFCFHVFCRLPRSIDNRLALERNEGLMPRPPPMHIAGLILSIRSRSASPQIKKELIFSFLIGISTGPQTQSWR